MRTFILHKDFYLVQDLAEKFHVNSETIKKWEKFGILPPASRDPKNGWRIWKKEDINSFEWKHLS